MSGVLAALLLASGCARRLPEEAKPAEVGQFAESGCRTLGVRFEQTDGACTPFSRMEQAVQLLGQRCDDETLTRGLQQLQQEAGPERVEQVLLGERVPGSDRHRVVVRYASSTPGSCPLDPKAYAASCEDCGVGKVLVAVSPPSCASQSFNESIKDLVKEELRTCKADELDAARARVAKAGKFHAVEVLCTRDTDDGLRRVRVNVANFYGSCARGPSQSDSSGSIGRRELTCSKGVTCAPHPAGGQECDCR